MATTKPDTTDPKSRTITLSNHAPVKIRDEDWPIIAESSWLTAAETGWLKVRRHADGRAIVYGGDTMRWTGPEDRRGGILVPPEGDLAAAIQYVGKDVGATERCVRDTIADLPPVEL